MPVCSFNIGAPAERIGQYKFGHLISAIDAETAVEEIVNFYDQLDHRLDSCVINS